MMQDLFVAGVVLFLVFAVVVVAGIVVVRAWTRPGGEQATPSRPGWYGREGQVGRAALDREPVDEDRPDRREQEEANRQAFETYGGSEEGT